MFLSAKRKKCEGQALALYFVKDNIVNRIIPSGYSKNKPYIELKMPFRDCADWIIQISPSKSSSKMLAFVVKVKWYVIYFPLHNYFWHFCWNGDLITGFLVSSPNSPILYNNFRVFAKHNPVHLMIALELCWQPITWEDSLWNIFHFIQSTVQFKHRVSSWSLFSS